MKQTIYSQHGDCLIYTEEKLPDNAKPIKGATLAVGEVTGHHHSLYDSIDDAVIKSTSPYDMGSKNVQMYEQPNKTLWVEILAPVFLKHPEHKPIEFKPGIYRIGIVQEYDHVEKLARKVVD